MAELKKITLPDKSILYHISEDMFKSCVFCSDFIYDGTWRDIEDVKILFSVFSKGTKSYPSAGAVNRRLDDLYSVNLSSRHAANTFGYVSGYLAEMLDTRFAEDGTDISLGAMQMMNELTLCPLTDKKGLPDPFRVLLTLDEFYKQYLNMHASPRSKAFDNYFARIYADREEVAMGKSFRHASELKEKTPESLWSSFQRFQSRASRRYGYCGSESPEAIAEKIGRTMGPVSGPATHDFPDGVFSVLDVPPFDLTEQDGFNQSELILGFVPGRPFSRDERLKLQLFDLLFGGSPFSKLFMTVREKLGLCYDISSNFSLYGNHIYVTCALGAESLQKAKETVVESLEEMAAGQISEEEMETARDVLKNDLRTVRDSPEAMLDFVMEYCRGDEERKPEDLMADLDRIGRDELVELAGSLKPVFSYELVGKGGDSSC